MPKERFTYPHEADPDIFREALAYSEADKGFTSTLIEKDWFRLFLVLCVKLNSFNPKSLERKLSRFLVCT